MVTALVGKNNYQILENKKRIITEFIKSYGDLSVEKLDAAEASEQAVYDAISNLPFLVEKKLVIIDEPSASKSLTEKLMIWLNGEDSSIDVLIVESNPDKRTAWYKFIVQNANLLSCDPMDERGLISWAVGYAKESGGAMTSSVAGSLVKSVGSDQQLIANEIDKLISYDKQITDDSLALLVDPTPQDTVFSPVSYTHLTLPTKA